MNYVKQQQSDMSQSVVYEIDAVDKSSKACEQQIEEISSLLKNVSKDVEERLIEPVGKIRSSVKNVEGKVTHWQ